MEQRFLLFFPVITVLSFCIFLYFLCAHEEECFLFCLTCSHLVNSLPADIVLCKFYVLSSVTQRSPVCHWLHHLNYISQIHFFMGFLVCTHFVSFIRNQVRYSHLLSGLFSCFSSDHLPVSPLQKPAVQAASGRLVNTLIFSIFITLSINTFTF